MFTSKLLPDIKAKAQECDWSTDGSNRSLSELQVTPSVITLLCFKIPAIILDPPCRSQHLAIKAWWQCYYWVWARRVRHNDDCCHPCQQAERQTNICRAVGVRCMWISDTNYARRKAHQCWAAGGSGTVCSPGFYCCTVLVADSSLCRVGPCWPPPLFLRAGPRLQMTPAQRERYTSGTI